MSSLDNTTKRKISQSDLKRFMNEHKNKLNPNAKKIESPLAKYLENGQLTCIVCDCPINNESLWSGHISSRLHKDKISTLKRKKMETRDNHVFIKPHPPSQTSKKRPGSPIKKEESTDENPPKKLKGILKNPLKPDGPNLPKNSKINEESNQIPSDFFDGNETKTDSPMEVDGRVEKSNSEEIIEKMDVEISSSNNNNNNNNIKDESLPEGFFDDPHLDAKARNADYKDPIEEEWEKFQRAIREETSVSAQIISEDQDVATAERQLDEIEDQMKNWSKVLNMERKKEEVAKNILKKESQDEKSDDSSDDEEEFDEYLDWRSKRSFK